VNLAAFSGRTRRNTRGDGGIRCAVDINQVTLVIGALRFPGVARPTMVDLFIILAIGIALVGLAVVSNKELFDDEQQDPPVHRH
jgi:hypothetical protein